MRYGYVGYVGLAKEYGLVLGAFFFFSEFLVVLLKALVQKDVFILASLPSTWNAQPELTVAVERC